MLSSLLYVFVCHFGVDPAQNLTKIQKMVMRAHTTKQ